MEDCSPLLSEGQHSFLTISPTEGSVYQGISHNKYFLLRLFIHLCLLVFVILKGVVQPVLNYFETNVFKENQTAFNFRKHFYGFLFLLKIPLYFLFKKHSLIKIILNWKSEREGQLQTSEGSAWWKEQHKFSSPVLF